MVVSQYDDKGVGQDDPKKLAETKKQQQLQHQVLKIEQKAQELGEKQLKEERDNEGYLQQQKLRPGDLLLKQQLQNHQQQQQLFAKLKLKRSPKLSVPIVLIICALGGVLVYRFYQEIFVIDPVVGIYGLFSVFMIFFAFLISHTKYRDPSVVPNNNHDNDSNRDQQQHFASIIIAAKNEPVIIKDTVYSCLTSGYDKSEIILVNDGSTDDTAKTMDLLREQSPARVKVIHLAQNMGKRRAIREGLKHTSTKSDIIVLLDSDTVIENTAIEKIIRTFDDPEVGAATSYARPLNADQNALAKIQDTWYHGSFSVMKAMESSFGTVTCCSGMLSAYRKEAIAVCIDAWCNDKFLGVEFKPGDDRQLTSYLIGGSKHYLGAHNKVWKTVYCESAHSLTEAPSTLRKFVNQQVRWKKSWVRVFFFTAPYYYKDRPAMAAAFYYIQMAFSLISPLIAIRNLVLLPILGHYPSALVYVAGILFIALTFALQFKFQNPNSGGRWLYRFLLGFMSLGFLSILMFYALLTIRRNSWLTR